MYLITKKDTFRKNENIKTIFKTTTRKRISKCRLKSEIVIRIRIYILFFEKTHNKPKTDINDGLYQTTVKWFP